VADWGSGMSVVQHRGSNCLLSQAVDGCVMCPSTSSSCVTVCVESKPLTAAMLNTSKMFEEIGDLYAKQVSLVCHDNYIVCNDMFVFTVLSACSACILIFIT